MNKNGSHWIRPERRLALYIRDEFTCGYCGTALKGADPSEVTLDHLVPRSAGGDNTNANLICACRPCNSARQDKPWIDYATAGAVERIQTRRWQFVNVPLAKAIISGEIDEMVAEVEAGR